jgi:hypothetical protein
MPDPQSVNDTENVSITDTQPIEESASDTTDDTEEDINLEDVFEPKQESKSSEKIDRAEAGFNGFVKKLESDLSNLSYEESLDTFLSKPLKVRNALREQFPEKFTEDEYGPKEEQEPQSDFDTLYDIRREEEKALEAQKQSVQESLALAKKVLEDNPKFAEARGKTFKKKIKSEIESGKSQKDAVYSVIAEMTLSGEFVPEKTREQIKSEGKKEIGQFLPESRKVADKKANDPHKDTLPDLFKY